jgi:hypothetical protein
MEGVVGVTLVVGDLLEATLTLLQVIVKELSPTIPIKRAHEAMSTTQRRVADSVRDCSTSER